MVSVILARTVIRPGSTLVLDKHLPSMILSSLVAGKTGRQRRMETHERRAKMPTVSIAGLDKADVLAALYNASRPQGLGFMQYDPAPMTREGAASILNGGHTYFDYLKGRVMKLRLDSDLEIDTWGYDRDNGQGAAERAINALRNQGLDSPDIVAAHTSGTVAAAELAESAMGIETTVSGGLISIGLSDLKHVLGPKVREAISNNQRN